MDVLPTLPELDRELALGDGGIWDEVAFEEPRLVALGEDAAAISYRFRGRRRTDMLYEARMTSAMALYHLVFWQPPLTVAAPSAG